MKRIISYGILIIMLVTYVLSNLVYSYEGYLDAGKQDVVDDVDYRLDTVSSLGSFHLTDNILEFNPSGSSGEELIDFLANTGKFSGKGEISVRVETINEYVLGNENLVKEANLNPVQIGVLIDDSPNLVMEVFGLSIPYLSTYVNEMSFCIDQACEYKYLYKVWDGIKFKESYVTIEISEVNYEPIANKDKKNALINVPVTIDVLKNDVDFMSDNLWISSVSDGETDYETITITPTSLGEMVFSYTVTDGVYETDSTVTLEVLDKEDAYVYLSFGDSIANGNSFEKSLVRQYINAFPLQINEYLKTKNDHVVYFDNHVSGDNVYDIYEHLMDPGIRKIVESLDMLTIYVGANDLMDAARRPIVGPIDFYTLDWEVADEGHVSFENYWPKILHEINTINPDVMLVVMTQYNTYSDYDMHEGWQKHTDFPELNLYELVEYYFWNDTEDFYGMNYLISEGDNLFETYEGYDDALTIDYRVVDVYTDFENNYGDRKSSVLSFYNNYAFFLGLYVPIQDPHPTQYGQDQIFKLFKEVYESTK